MSALVARPAPPRRVSSQRNTLVMTAHVRLMMLMLMIAAGVLVIILRLTWLAAFSAPATSPDAVSALVPLRGDIVDRNGAPLARTIDAWSIGIHPNKVISDRRELAAKLANLIPEHDEAWYFDVLTSGKNFAYLAKRAMPETVSRVNALGEPAVAFAREPERLYPQSTLAAHALGFLDYDGRGMSGMERVLDEQLTNPALRGQPVPLSIDTRIQAAMESELGAAMLSFKARGAAGVLLDVHTGEVLSMVSLPVFNPNHVKGSTEDQLRNNVTQSVYELGSTFKPITMAAAIDSGVVTSMARRFDATQPIKVGRFTIHDDRGDEQERWLDIPETLIYSSNIATARIADELGAEREKAMFRRLGFDTRPDVELREKGRPIWPAYWARTTTMTTAYGHGIAVTPLHLANAYAALVNGGIWRPTTMLKIAPGKAPAGRRVISQATSDRMRQLLRLIVLEGTGKKAEAAGYRVGGKTGTAEVAGKGGYERHTNVSTFAAAFPMDAPRYVVVAMLDSPIGNAQSYGLTTAAWTVAPVVGRVITRVGPMLGVMPDEQLDVDVSELMPLLWRPQGREVKDTR
ncbi:MAG: penicillin-binding protein 2 [Sphingomonas sp.]|nr:penicillin-binding protein 2 [Sphingomonas sp.]